MRTVTAGLAILAIGILAALPFRHRSGPVEQPNRQPHAATPQPFVTPLEEVPLDQFAPRQYWPVATQLGIEAAETVPAVLPPLPESYTDVAVPLAMPQAVANRYSATQPLRGGWSDDRASTALAAASPPPTDARLDAWQRGLPLGQPLRGTATMAAHPAPYSAAAALAGPDSVTRQEAFAGALSPPVLGSVTQPEPSPSPWLSPEEVALAAQSQQDAAAPSATASRPPRHAITAVSAPLNEAAEQPQQPAAEARTERFFIREPVH